MPPLLLLLRSGLESYANEAEKLLSRTFGEGGGCREEEELLVLTGASKLPPTSPLP